MTNLAEARTMGTDTTVARAARGDEAAFTRLVEQHHAAMARVAYVICGDAEVTRDAVQNAWSIAWRRLRSLREPERVGVWLVAIAANEARGAVRHRRRHPVTDLSPAMGIDAGGDPADRIEVVDLQRALAGLGADDRRLLALRYVAGHDSAAIADHLGLSASGVRSRLSRLTERLRTEFNDA